MLTRLLFGREFHIEDSLCLWDGIFAECLTASMASSQQREGGEGGEAAADSSIVTTVEYLAVVMVIYIR